MYFSIDKIITLERDDKNKTGRHYGLKGILNLASDIKKYNFDKVFIFNSSLRFKLISKLSGIKNIYQYPLFEKKYQHVIHAAQNFLKKKLDLSVESNPKIKINDQDSNNSLKKFNIRKDQTNIVLGIGGSGPTKRIPSNIFLDVIEKLTQIKKCKFFLATGKDHEEQIILNEILLSRFKNFCIPLDNLSIKESLEKGTEMSSKVIQQIGARI